MKATAKGITLQVNGREMTFSKQELTAILEIHFPNEANEQVTIAKGMQVPTEGKWFDVNPQALNKRLFRKKRKNKRQEMMRRIIRASFAELKRNPKKYGKKFKTLIPKKMWQSKTVAELKQLACELGDHNADWVEQALEWAQRICNGESWEEVCCNADTVNWYRLIVWKNGYARLVGGSRYDNVDYPASDVGDNDYYSNDRISNAVPLVVLYEK